MHSFSSVGSLIFPYLKTSHGLKFGSTGYNSQLHCTLGLIQLSCYWLSCKDSVLYLPLMGRTEYRFNAVDTVTSSDGLAGQWNSSLHSNVYCICETLNHTIYSCIVHVVNYTMGTLDTVSVLMTFGIHFKTLSINVLASPFLLWSQWDRSGLNGWKIDCRFFLVFKSKKPFSNTVFVY